MRTFIRWVALAGALAPTLSQAQSTAARTPCPQSTHFGVRAGLNRTGIYDLAIYQQKATERIGVVAGAFVCWKIGSHIALQPEVTFSQQGSHLNKWDGAAPLSQTIVLSYLNVPLLLKVNVAQLARQRLLSTPAARAHWHYPAGLRGVTPASRSGGGAAAHANLSAAAATRWALEQYL
ncbi:hypothetical protein GCM10027346_42730 [Hymenobacter seoulensis]